MSDISNFERVFLKPMVDRWKAEHDATHTEIKAMGTWRAADLIIDLRNRIKFLEAEVKRLSQ